MIPYQHPEEPTSFDDEVRVPGLDWVYEKLLPRLPYGAKDQRLAFPGHWRWEPGAALLEEAARARCCYTGMYDFNGTVDHYRSRDNFPDLAYEWTNLRYTAGWVNSRKQNLDEDLLDPCEVEAGWFEIVLPSLHLLCTAKVPAAVRARAERTLERLGLAFGPKVMRQRQGLYQQFREDGIHTLRALARFAPLLAESILNRLTDLPLGQAELPALHRFLHGEVTLAGLRREAPTVATAIEQRLPYVKLRHG